MGKRIKKIEKYLGYHFKKIEIQSQSIPNTINYKKMNSIKKIFIACYKNDYWQTKICVASIRKWYPTIPIFLIKDIYAGKFCTRELENYYNVKIFETQIKKFGWGVSKLEPYFISESEKVLILDSDIVFIGPLLSKLEKQNEDFIVSADYIDQNAIHSDWMKRTYYDLSQIQLSVNKNFVYPGYVFNTGQLVATTNLLQRTDFNNLIKFTDPPVIINKKTFACADQGILNYLLPALKSKISIGLSDFKIWSNSPKAKEIELEKILANEYQYLIHWAGGNPRYIKKMQRADILLFFQKLYYSKIPLGKQKQILFNFHCYAIIIFHKIKNIFFK